MRSFKEFLKKFGYNTNTLVSGIFATIVLGLVFIILIPLGLFLIFKSLPESFELFGYQFDTNMFNHSEENLYYDEGFFAAAVFVFTVFAGFGALFSFYRRNSNEYDAQKRQHELATSEFLSNLAISYSESPSFTKIYNLLDKIYYSQQGRETSFIAAAEHGKACEELRNLINENFAEISNYLSFFEIFMVLINQKTIEIESLNNLFNYRFFLAVKNQQIRTATIEQRREYFVNIINLEREWERYRRSEGLPIIEEYGEYPI